MSDPNDYRIEDLKTRDDLLRVGQEQAALGRQIEHRYGMSHDQFVILQEGASSKR